MFDQSSNHCLFSYLQKCFFQNQANRRNMWFDKRIVCQCKGLDRISRHASRCWNVMYYEIRVEVIIVL